MVKLSTYLIADEKLTPAERLRIIKEIGFDAVCFGVSSLIKSEITGITPDLCAGIGLEIENVHLSGKGTHALWAEGEEGDAMVDRFCTEIVACRELGVKTGVLHAVYGYETPAPMGELGLSRFERIVECAEKNGVTLALENSLHDAYLCYALDHIQSPNFRFCFDSGHHHAFARDMALLSQYGDRLAATHLHDNEGARDIHLMPFDGSIDWQETARLLAGTPYGRNYICAEFSGVSRRKYPGKRAEELYKIFSDSPAYRDGMIRITDELMVAYEGLPFEVLFERLYTAMRRIADSIEAAIKEAGRN